MSGTFELVPDASPPRAPGDLTGRVLKGRYRVTKFIASGGMAQVWEADDDVLARTVAVKVLRPALAADAQFVARFRAEAISAARLSHPAIVSIYDTWTDDGVEAIVMELVRGTTLRGLLDRRGRLGVDDAIAIAGHVADALSAAHQANLIHRDVKPANVLLSDDGRVLVTDFGIAKATETADITSESVLLGTAKYLAPEQVEGKRIDARSDVYALGVVLYEMLCGQAPFSGETDTATALARLHRDPTPPRALRPDLSEAMAAVVDRALARDPEDRYSSAAQFHRALVDARRHPDRPATMATPADHTDVVGAHVDRRPPTPPGPPPSPEPTPPARAGRSTSRRWALPLAIGVLVVVAVTVTALLVSRTGDGGIRRPSFLPKGPDDTAAAAPVISGAAAFDPEGEPPDKENNNQAPLAVDADPVSAWTTERYGDPVLASLKSGVGIYVTLEEPAELGQFVVSSPTAGWTASVYVVAEAPATDLAGWGEPIATEEGIAAGKTTFELDGRTGSAVLLWITRTGDFGRVNVADLTVEAPG